MTTSGQITGTPTQLGSYSFQTTVTDSTSLSSSTNVSMKVTGPPPSIYGITPSSGTTAGGTTVTISGKNLQTGALVAFGGFRAVEVVAGARLLADAPALRLAAGGAICGVVYVALAAFVRRDDVRRLTAALGAFLPPHAVAAFPGWETLPHERLSPRSDTVGQRIAVLRRGPAAGQPACRCPGNPRGDRRAGAE